jgi:hypothetical protein
MLVAGPLVLNSSWKTTATLLNIAMLSKATTLLLANLGKRFHHGI